MVQCALASRLLFLVVELSFEQSFQRGKDLNILSVLNGFGADVFFFFKP